LKSIRWVSLYVKARTPFPSPIAIKRIGPVRKNVRVKRDCRGEGLSARDGTLLLEIGTNLSVQNGTQYVSIENSVAVFL
jgi:hypothetical protein